MADLPNKLEDYGAQRHLAQGLADGRLTASPAKIGQLAGFFGVPTAWFESEDWRPLLSAQPETQSLATKDDVDAALARVSELLGELHDELQDVRNSQVLNGEGRAVDQG